MVSIRVLPEAAKRDINLPESVEHRSVKGDTLYLVPGMSREVTREEWAFIKTNHADFLPNIQLLSAPDA